MADEVDVAQIEEERHLAIALRNHANSARLMPTGFCRDPRCEDDVPPGVLFCGPACRDSFDKQAEAAKRSGRRFP